MDDLLRPPAEVEAVAAASYRAAVAVTDRREALDGLAITSREGEGPLIVLVHGAMDRAGSFGRVARHLADRALVRYDRRGYGRSQPGRGVDLAGHVGDLETVIGGREAVVVGHSFGGTVALAAAGRPGTTIRALLAYESPVPTAAPVVPFPHDASEPPDVVAERFMRAMVGDRIWDRLPPRTRDERRAEGPALLADLAAVAAGATEADPAAVTVPLVVGVGGRSSAGHHARARALAAAIDGAELAVVAEASHGVHLEAPSAFAVLALELADRA